MNKFGNWSYSVTNHQLRNPIICWSVFLYPFITRIALALYSTGSVMCDKCDERPFQANSITILWLLPN